MKLFTVKVGKYSRKGNFIEYFTRAVSTPDDYFYGDLHSHFSKLYAGLDVKIAEAMPFEDIASQLLPPPPCRGDAGRLSGFKIRYTEDEQKLFDEYIAFTKQAKEKRECLEDSINARYRKLSYCDSATRCIGLNTSPNGTVCTSLPIKSDDFFRLVKEGADESERLVMTPATADDNDLPF